MQRFFILQKTLLLVGYNIYIFFLYIFFNVSKRVRSKRENLVGYTTPDRIFLAKMMHTK